LKGKETLDSYGKKVKINIDRCFYLLGDCCNESLGIKINGIIATGPEVTSYVGSLDSTMKAGYDLNRKTSVLNADYDAKLYQRDLTLEGVKSWKGIEKKDSSSTQAGTSEEGEGSTTTGGTTDKKIN
ncbi:MAG: hypothetical protein WC875_01475, partial [Candidatus Absconditabacterales bacterium]